MDTTPNFSNEEGTMTDNQFLSIIKTLLSNASDSNNISQVIKELERLLPENEQNAD